MNERFSLLRGRRIVIYKIKVLLRDNDHLFTTIWYIYFNLRVHLIFDRIVELYSLFINVY